MGLRESIARCKQALPLPELWRVLGLNGTPRRCCRSPFRDDKNESFSVFERDGFWFWRDHALDIGGDEIDFIEQGRGLEKNEAIKAYHELAGIEMPQPTAAVTAGKSTLGKMVKVYDYRNADGQLVHQTVRFEPKNFRQRRPAAKGMRQSTAAGLREAKCDRNGDWWLWTLEGIEPVLYNLPAILGAPRTETIFACEGEKDSDVITARGGIATTAPMGAGKWRPSYTETLKGRDVVIVGDRDAHGKKAGENHVAKVAAELDGKANRLRVANWEKICPDIAADKARKIDVYDFIAA